MRIRWHRSWLLGLAVGACSLNPQPDLPGESAGSATPTATGGSPGVAGSSAGGAPASGGVSGSGAVLLPGTGGLDTDAGSVTTGAAGEAGASAEAGEGGAPQLAPGPAR
jgi:hypothetical protein